MLGHCLPGVLCLLGAGPRILVTLKRHLQKSSAEKLPFLDEEGHSIVSFIKTINIKDCI